MYWYPTKDLQNKKYYNIYIYIYIYILTYHLKIKYQIKKGLSCELVK